jgi:multiple antibiotic resistance protein
MDFHFDQLVTVIFTLFAVIDIVGSIPLLIAMKEKSGAIKSLRVTLISGALMILFLFLGKPFLQILGLDVKSFAVGGSIVTFLSPLKIS